jgi:hypothetical protein
MSTISPVEHDPNPTAGLSERLFDYLADVAGLTHYFFLKYRKSGGGWSLLTGISMPSLLRK